VAVPIPDRIISLTGFYFWQIFYSGWFFIPAGLFPKRILLPKSLKTQKKELPDLLIGQLTGEIPAISFTCPPFLRISRFVTE
jgi:hypothetical protein